VTPHAAVFTIYPVRVLAPDGGIVLLTLARSWLDALTTVQVLLLMDGIQTSRRDRR